MRHFLILIIILFSTVVKAQNDPLLSLYWNNKLWHNPAYAGAEDKMTVSFSSRRQWVSVLGNPVTGIVSYDQPLQKINSGVGIIAMYDQAGALSLKQFGLLYSYNLKLSEKAGLRFGTQLSLAHQTIKGSWISTDPNGGDPAIPPVNSSSYNTDIDIGTWLTISNFYFGLSTKHLLEPEFNNVYTVARTYYAMSGYLIKIGPTLSTTPSFIIRNVAATTAIDINNTFTYFDKYFLGTTFRPDNVNTFSFNSGIKLSFFEFSLSYSLPGEFGGASAEANIKAKF